VGKFWSAKLNLPTIFLHGVSCDQCKRAFEQYPAKDTHKLPLRREILKQSGIFQPRHKLL